MMIMMRIQALVYRLGPHVALQYYSLNQVINLGVTKQCSLSHYSFLTSLPLDSFSFPTWYQQQIRVLCEWSPSAAAVKIRSKNENKKERTNQQPQKRPTKSQAHSHFANIVSQPNTVNQSKEGCIVVMTDEELSRYTQFQISQQSSTPPSTATFVQNR